MRRSMFFLMLTPVFCMASLLLLFHDVIPQVWRQYLKPTVIRMRKGQHHEYVFRNGVQDRKHTIPKLIIHSFNHERDSIIRLIRLEGDSIMTRKVTKLSSDHQIRA